MKLADEWRHFWKWSQTWLITLISVAPLLYEQLEQMQALIPAPWFKTGMILLGVMTIANNVRKKTA